LCSLNKTTDATAATISTTTTATITMEVAGSRDITEQGRGGSEQRNLSREFKVENTEEEEDREKDSSSECD
jgi:hypothetical protein